MSLVSGPQGSLKRNQYCTTYERSGHFRRQNFGPAGVMAYLHILSLSFFLFIILSLSLLQYIV